MKISLITLVMISLMPLQAWSMDQVSKESMVQYRNQGWKVEEKKSFVESRPGKRPYQMLKRDVQVVLYRCLLYTSPSPRDKRQSRMPSSA